MKKMFEAVQSQFTTLSTLLDGLDFTNDLEKPDVLARLNDTLNEAYVLLNQGFCESATMCEKCVSNRDQLQHLSRMIDHCEETKKMSEEARVALMDFTQNLPHMLEKMRSVYQETMQKA